MVEELTVVKDVRKFGLRGCRDVRKLIASKEWVISLLIHKQDNNYLKGDIMKIQKIVWQVIIYLNFIYCQVNQRSFVFEKQGVEIRPNVL